MHLAHHVPFETFDYSLHFCENCLPFHVLFETPAMVYDSIKTRMVLIMAYVSLKCA